MGIFGALNTAVSGLRAQAYSIENISGNIANSQTVGFKRVDTSFVDLVADRPRAQALSGSVRGLANQAISVQGEIRPTSISTNVAINGSGFFSVSQFEGVENGVMQFSPVNLFTRRGDFQLDKDGYLVNGAGMFLRGDSINNEGQVTSTNGILRIDNSTMPARATNRIEYSVVLPRTPATNAARLPGGDDLLDPGLVNANGEVVGDDATTFLNQTIAGGSVIAFTDEGEAIDVQLRWGKLPLGPGGEEEYALFALSNLNAAGTDPAWVQIGTYDFAAATPPTSFPIPLGTQLSGIQLPQNVELVFAGQGIQRFQVPNGLVQALDIRQNGYPSGILQDVDITSDGRIAGIYSNGQIASIARISIAQFAAPNMLKARDGGTFEATADSGAPVFSPEGSRLVSGSVEQSNSDIAEEFSKLIVTQQAYQANTRVVSAAQQMMDATINMVR